MMNGADCGDNEAVDVPLTDRRLEWDLPGPMENPEERRARLLRDGSQMAAFVAETLKHAIWAAERIVLTHPDDMPASARRFAARALAEAARVTTYQCERIALREPVLLGDARKMIHEWPVLCSRHKADNTRLIGEIQKALFMPRKRHKVPSMARRESNLNWVLWQVVRWGRLPFRGRFVQWAEHPVNTWPSPSPLPEYPFTRQTFRDWFQNHFRPFLGSVPGWSAHPAFKATVSLSVGRRPVVCDGIAAPTAVHWNDIESRVRKSLVRLRLLLTPDLSE